MSATENLRPQPKSSLINDHLLDESLDQALSQLIDISQRLLIDPLL